MTNYNIKVISDTVCPFCYLGKKRLEKAIELHKRAVAGGADDQFTVTWHPFYLDPTLPKTGIPVQERMAQRFGPGRLEAMRERMQRLGEAEGIHFTYDSKIGNTRDAHRLVQLAKTKARADPGAEDRVVSSLFRSYFEEGGDVTSHDMLAAAAERAGLDGAEVRAWLAKDAGGKDVDREVDEAYALGVHGVPHFVINDHFEVGGAQDVQTFLEEFAKAKAAAA